MRFINCTIAFTMHISMLLKVNSLFSPDVIIHYATLGVSVARRRHSRISKAAAEKAKLDALLGGKFVPMSVDFIGNASTSIGRLSPCASFLPLLVEPTIILIEMKMFLRCNKYPIGTSLTQST